MSYQNKFKKKDHLHSASNRILLTSTTSSSTSDSFKSVHLKLHKDKVKSVM